MNINKINNTNFTGLKILKASQTPTKLLEAIKSEAMNGNSNSFLHDAIRTDKFDIRLIYENKNHGSQSLDVWYNDFMYTIKAKSRSIDGATKEFMENIKKTQVSDIIKMIYKKG